MSEERDMVFLLLQTRDIAGNEPAHLHRAGSRFWRTVTADDPLVWNQSRCAEMKWGGQGRPVLAL
ncbi:MAG: hypothetical protein QF473_02280, partial [Planctomycetota bacterium]|nr:hypothetical protein [Planctomycetota bacterium]